MIKLRKLVASLGMVAILSTLVVSTAAQAGTFTDVPDGEWFSPFVATLVDAGVVDGTKGTFRPGDTLNRAEALKMAIEACEKEGTTEISFPDVKEGDWFYSYVQTGVANTIVSGNPDGTFRPANAVNRAEFAKMVVNACGLEKSSLDSPFSDVEASAWYKESVVTAWAWSVVDGYSNGTFQPNGVITRSAAAKMVAMALDPKERSTEPPVEPPVVTDAPLSVAVYQPEDFKVSVPVSADYVPVMDLEFTAGSESADVTKLVLTRKGLSKNTDVDTLSLFVGGEQYGSNASLNSDNTVTFNLGSQPVKVAAGESVTVNVKFNPASGANTSDILVFALEEAGHVGGAVASGSFPLESNQMSLTSTTIGSYTIAAGPDSPSSDNSPDAGDKDVRLLQWRITAGSGEDLVAKSFTLTENGTAAATDYEKLKVVTDKDNKVICEGDTWNASGTFTCTPTEEILIKKGTSESLSLKVDIKSGSGTTMSAKIKDSGAYGIQLLGKDYGYTVGTSSTWAGTATAQTVASGSLVVTKAPDTPATGNVAAGATGQVLVRYRAEAKGEPVTVTEFVNTVLLGTATYDQVTNCVLKNETTGKTLAGPVDATTATDDYIKFSDTFTLPLGTNTLAVSCDLSTGMSGDDTVQLGFDDSNTGEDSGGNAVDVAVTAKGGQTNDTITASPASVDVLGNVLTVKGGALSAIAMTTPAASYVIPGTQSVHLANLQIDATTSGEDVKVTTIAITSTPAGGASANDLQNIGVYTDYVKEADCTGTSQSWSSSLGLCRLDDLNQATTSAANTAEDETFSLETPLVVKKGEAAIVKVYADYKAGVGASGENFTVDWKATSCVSGTGATTATTVSDATCNTGSGQAMTYVASGTLTTSWGSNPTANDNVIAGTNKVHFGDYKMVAANEDVIIRTAAFTRATGTTGLTGVDSNFGLIHLYMVKGTTETLLQSAYLGASSKVTFDLESAGVATALRTVVKDETAKLRLYADLNATPLGAAHRSGSSEKFTLAATTDIVATGGGSGSAINASAAVTGSTYKIVRRTLPTIALATTGLSTNLSTGTMKLIQFTITADPAGDVSFKKMSFDLTLSDADAAASTNLAISAVKLYNAADSSTGLTNLDPDGTDADESNDDTCADGAGGITAYEAQSNIICALNGEEIIAAGTTKTYFLEGVMAATASNDSVSTRLAADGTTLVANSNAEFVDGHATEVVVLDTAAAKSGTETTTNWIWSDLASGAKHTEEEDTVTETDAGEAQDWTSGFLVKSLPSSYFVLSRS